jgi:hypothetical protein
LTAIYPFPSRWINFLILCVFLGLIHNSWAHA